MPRWYPPSIFECSPGVPRGLPRGSARGPPGSRDFTLPKMLDFILYNICNIDFVVIIMIVKVSPVSLPRMELPKFRIKSTKEQHGAYLRKTSIQHNTENPGGDLTFLKRRPQIFRGDPLGGRGKGYTHKFIMHLYEFTWLQWPRGLYWNFYVSNLGEFHLKS